jgi:hypothetical protein
MAEAAAKQGDRVISDGTSKVWVKPPPLPDPPKTVSFSYDGELDDNLVSDVLIMGKPAAVVGSTAQNKTPPNQQPQVIAAGTLLTTVNNTGTITGGSSSVLIHGKPATRNGDSAQTWDYGTPPQPGIGKEIENAHIEATGPVLIGN